MTDANYMEPKRASAGEIEDCAADWLMERQDQHNWTDDDQTKLDEWLAASLAHQVAFFRLEAALGRTERLRALLPSLQLSTNFWPTVLKTAAAISLIVGAGITGAQYLLGPRTVAYQTSVGDRETLSLGDGSQIELNTDTSLRVAHDLPNRQVWLDKGEAYFQIRHDARHPFVVVAGVNRITDLGTRFVLRRYPDHLEVALVEGGIRLDAMERGSKAHVAILKPGDVATVGAGSISVVRASQQNLADELGWRRGVLTFRYTTLARAADEFNRYNRTQIVISDPHVARMTVYGAFAANDAVGFADAVQNEFKLHIANLRGQIVLTR
jgi:transmembrane sensor